MILPLRAATLIAGMLFSTSVCSETVEAQAPSETQALSVGGGIRIPDVEAAIMPLAEVRVGMIGYGKSVFAGTAIETFPVVVRSVVSDSSARRGTIWVECTDARMQHSGPVQGMSGSPIYLWDDDAADTTDAVRVDGEGGRLVGAFAFGYSNVNVCLVGVQPIEYMREVGANAVAAEDRVAQSLDRAAQTPRRVGQTALARTFAALTTMADEAEGERGASGLLRHETRSLRALNRVLGLDVNKANNAHETFASRSQAQDQIQSPQPLGLPVGVGSAQAARWLAPVLAPAGLVARSGATPHGAVSLIAGTPPSNVDGEATQLEPGSVMSIPLAWGDLDLNASGTVTEVRPDGTVLAFGHAMDAVGDTRLPMATGYTHFVVSRISTSFKQASSLQLVGTIFRDEQSAVAGRPLPPGIDLDDPNAAVFGSAPVSVHIEHPSQPARDYNFHVVDDPMMTSGVLAAVIINAANAVQDFPLEHTLRLTGELHFSGDRTLSLDVTLPDGGARGLAYAILPYVGAMMQNQFEPLKLKGAELSVVVEDQLKFAEIESATLDRGVARAGETLRVDVRLALYHAASVTRSVELILPPDLPAGEYELMVTDAYSHADRLLMSRPDLMNVHNVDALFTTVKAMAVISDKTLFVALARPEMGLAVGDRPLPSLPKSRASVMVSAPTTRVAAYPRFVNAHVDFDQVISGDLVLPLIVEPSP
ncbi:MAG: hypothetical protein V3V20_01540 [Algisphaera sp.]